MALKGQKFRKCEWKTKVRIVKRHLEEHISVKELARQEGMASSMICRWVREYRENGEEGLKPKQRTGNPYAALHTSNSLTEIERLWLLVAKQEIEIERLKKGIGWKELVQTRCTLPATTGLRNCRKNE